MQLERGVKAAGEAAQLAVLASYAGRDANACGSRWLQTVQPGLQF
jgi:hypothetical protein